MAATALVASCLGDAVPGGLFVLGIEGFCRLDHLSTTGIAVSEDGARLARVLWTDDDPNGSGDLFIYDGGGLAVYRRLDDVREPHGVVWHGGELTVVSTLTNDVVTLDDDGRQIRRWSAPGLGDFWHINSVTRHDGRLLASAFGRFDRHRGWARPHAREGAGIVVDTVTGKDVLTGFTCPHDPTFLDGTWLVCNSGCREVLRLDRSGNVLARCHLDGFTRGVAHDNEHVFVGVSAHRLTEDEGRARVVALDRATLDVRGSWPLPCKEVFALEWVEPELLRGLRIGTATNPLRLIETARLVAGEGPPPAAPAPRVDAGEIARSVLAGDLASCSFRLSWDSDQPAPETAVSLIARWQLAGEVEPSETRRVRASPPTAAGETQRLYVWTPREPGAYRFSLEVEVGGPGPADFGLVLVAEPGELPTPTQASVNDPPDARHRRRLRRPGR